MLACLHVVSLVFSAQDEFVGRDFFVALFELTNEGKIATWYSACNFLLCSILLAVTAVAQRKRRAPFFLHWAVLSAIFLFFSFDEATSIHEMMSHPVRTALGTSGFFYHAWVIVGIASVAILGLAYWRFMANLPARTRRLFFTAAAFYLSAVIVLEMIGGNCVSRGQDVRYILALASAEELLEMIGLLIFIYALLDYMEERVQ